MEQPKAFRLTGELRVPRGGELYFHAGEFRTSATGPMGVCEKYPIAVAAGPVSPTPPERDERRLELVKAFLAALLVNNDVGSIPDPEYVCRMISRAAVWADAVLALAPKGNGV